MGSKDAPFPDLQNEYMVWYVPMNYMEVMTKIRKLKKKKKKKKGGGWFGVGQWVIFTVFVHLNSTSVVVIKVFPFQREIPYCFSSDYYYYYSFPPHATIKNTRHIFSILRDIYQDYLEKKNLTHRQNSIYSNRIISPFTENTVSRWTQEPSLISKIWLLEWVGVMVRMQKYQKKVSRKVSRVARFRPPFRNIFYLRNHLS